jgi:hypothetical protein
MSLCAIIDSMGIYGHIFHYSFVIAFAGGAFLIFISLWRKKRLDMDESPKYQMLQDEEGEHYDSRCK